MPQRLARLDGPRPRHPAVPARARATSWPASSRRSATGSSGGRRAIGSRSRSCARAGRAGSALAGDHQICDRQTQPGFTHWGSFAELTAIDWADVNLVALPDGLEFDAAAALGCRFATAYRAVLQVGRVRAGEWLAVHGCGGVGLSAVMIAAAAGARVVARRRRPTRRWAAPARRAPSSPSRSAPTSASSPAAAPTSRSTRSAARRRARRRSPGCASAAATSRSACSPTPPRVPMDLVDRPRARAPRLARHGRARLPGDARARGGRAAAPRSAGHVADRARRGAAGAGRDERRVAGRDHGDPPAHRKATPVRISSRMVASA